MRPLPKELADAIRKFGIYQDISPATYTAPTARVPGELKGLVIGPDDVPVTAEELRTVAQAFLDAADWIANGELSRPESPTPD